MMPCEDIIYHILHSAHFILCAAYCIVYTVYTLQTTQYTVYTLQTTQYTVYTLQITQYTVCSTQNEVCTMQYMIYNIFTRHHILINTIMNYKFKCVLHAVTVKKYRL